MHRTERSTVDASLVRDLNTPGLVSGVIRLALHSVATFVIVLAVSLAILAVAPMMLGYGTVVVNSGSMQPSLDIADAVVLDTSVGEEAQGQLPVGAVIDYEIGAVNRIHRIIEVTENGYRTKGDANNSADAEIVRPESVRGAGVMVVPFAGLPSWLAGNGRWLHLVLLIAGLAAAGRMSRRSWLDALPSTPRSWNRRNR